MHGAGVSVTLVYRLKMQNMNIKVIVYAAKLLQNPTHPSSRNVELFILTDHNRDFGLSVFHKLETTTV